MSRHSAAFVPGIPLHRQVRDRIAAAIQERASARSMPLTDAHLSERFGVSRITVRRAVDDLVDAGLLYRVQGVGTFVRPKRVPEKLTLTSFLESWSGQGARPEVRIGEFERMPAEGAIAADLGAEEGEDLLWVQRLRFQHKVLVAVDDRYLRARDCPSLTPQAAAQSSLVDHLRDREGIALEAGEMDIEARLADGRDARLLRTRAGRPILARRVTFLREGGAPVLTGRSIYRADRVSYRVTVSA